MSTEFSDFVTAFRHALAIEIAPETNDSLDLNFMMYREGDSIFIFGGYGGINPGKFDMSVVGVSPKDAALRLAVVIKRGYRRHPPNIASMFRTDGIEGSRGSGPCPAGVDDH